MALPYHFEQYMHTFAVTICFVCCQQIRAVLTRPSHNSASFELTTKGKAVRAYTPFYPFPKEENW